MTLQQITTRAKQIRKKNPSKKWTACIKQASKELKAKAPAKRTTAKKVVRKKVVRKKRRIGAVKKKATRQTGRSSKLHDERYTAKAPGKRISRSKKVYYERRKNRSDKPGTLSGTGLSSLLSLHKLSKGNFDRLQNELKDATAKYKKQKDRGMKMILKVRIDRLKYEIRERKTVMAALATDLRRLSKKK